MIRSLKSLGLALVAVLAMSAVVASAAQATPQYTGSAYPVNGTGTNAVGNETFTTPGGTVQCDSHFSGSLAEPSSTLTVTPKYTNCKAFSFLNATVDMMGCDYLFHAGASLGEGKYSHTVDVVCEEGEGPITITAGTCKADVSSQSGLGTVTTTNLGDGTVTVQPNVSEITLNVTEDGFGCPFPGKGHYKGTYHGDVVLKNSETGGTISVSGS